MISKYHQKNNTSIYTYSKSIISKHDFFWVLALALIGTFINNIPYNNRISLLFQLSIAIIIFSFNDRRPVMMIIAYIFLNILPARLVGGFEAESTSFYTLNVKVCVLFAFIYLITDIFVFKNKYLVKYNFWLIAFSFFIFASYLWTISLQYYNFEFLWLCAAYFTFPYFIKSESDIILIILSYLFYCGLFCISIFPIVTGSNFYRGTLWLDPNFASFTIVLGILCALIFISLQSIKLTLFYKIILLVQILIGLILLGYFASRTAFICLSVILIIYLISNISKTLPILITILLITIFYLLLNFTNYFDPVLYRFSLPSTLSGGSRLNILILLIDSIEKLNVFRLLFGNGYLTASLTGSGTQAHNTYLSIMISFGFIGLCLFLGYQIQSLYIIIAYRLKPYFLIFICLFIYNFSLEPYSMSEGIVFFSILGSMGKIRKKVEDNSAHGTSQ